MRARGLTFHLLALGLLACSAGAVAAQSPQPQSGATEEFRPAFRYTLPAAIAPTADMLDVMAIASPIGSSQRNPAAHGVVVMDVTHAVTHPCPMLDGQRSRLDIGDTPESFLDDLESVAGVQLLERTATTLDGRPALMAMTDGIACEFADLHAAHNDWVALDIPSRIVVADVENSTIMVQTWAGSEAELAEWLPIADEFVASIDFFADGPVSADSSSPARRTAGSKPR